jgi:hypothetical protein
LSSSTPPSVSPQIGGHQSGEARCALRGTSGINLYVAKYGTGSGDNGSVTVYASSQLARESPNQLALQANTPLCPTLGNINETLLPSVRSAS